MDFIFYCLVVVIAIGTLYRESQKRTRNPLVDKLNARTWACKQLTSQDWVILDTETTGIDIRAEVIEIAVIDHTGNQLFHSFVRPLNISRMPPGAKRVHGISMSQLKKAPTFDKVRPELENILHGKRVLCFNAEYDQRLLRQSAKAAGINAVSLNFECVMLKYSAYVGKWSEYHKDYTFQKLPSAAHDALGDCLATLKVIHKMSGIEGHWRDTQSQEIPINESAGQ